MALVTNTKWEAPRVTLLPRVRDLGPARHWRDTRLPPRWVEQRGIVGSALPSFGWHPRDHPGRDRSSHSADHADANDREEPREDPPLPQGSDRYDRPPHGWVGAASSFQA